MASDLAATPVPAAWYGDLPPNSWRALLFAGMGWMFDVYDSFVLSLTIPALVAAFALSKAEAGAIGSILAGGLIVGGIVMGRRRRPDRARQSAVCEHSGLFGVHRRDRLRALGHLGGRVALHGRARHGRDVDLRRRVGGGNLGRQPSWQGRRADANGAAIRLRIGNRCHCAGRPSNGRAEWQWLAGNFTGWARCRR